MDHGNGRDACARMRVLNAECAARCKLSVATVCSKLALSDADCVGMFLIGSRLWGTAGEQSDWDFLIVLKKPNKEGKDHWTLHGGNIDATCMTVTTFCTRLKEHVFLSLLPCWLPPEWHWRRDAKLLPCVAGALNQSALLKSVGEEATRDWNVALKKSQKGQHDAARKVVLHAIRMLRICVAYAESGGGPGVQPPNLWCVDDIQVPSWGAADLRVEYGDLFDGLMARLREVCSQ